MKYREWDDYRGKIRSSKGGWKIGREIQSHGYDLINDLIGHYSYMQVVVLNATGKMPSRALADWVEAVHISMSWPDPRIWCNRIGALGGTSGASTVAATCAGVMAADSRSYGILPLIEGVEFIQRAKKEIDSGTDLERFVANEVAQRGGRPHLMGYARPVVKGDERVSVLEAISKKLGFERGRHLGIAYGIEEILSRDFDESINLNGYVSAFMSDRGFTPVEIYRIFCAVPFSGIVACQVDTSQRPPGSFAPLRATDIDYSGVEARQLPPD